MALGRVKGARGGERTPEACAGLARNVDRRCSGWRRRPRTACSADIFRVDPRELIVAEPVFHDPELKPVFDVLGRIASPQPASLFDSAAAPATASPASISVATPDGFGAVLARRTVGDLRRHRLSSRRRRRPSARRWRVPEREQAGSTLFIDAATRANLELVRTLSGSRDGSLLKAIDRTVTGAGARLLAERLTSPLTDPDAINARLDSVAFLLAEANLRDGAARVAEGRRRHAAGADAAGARPRRAARSRRASAPGLEAARRLAELLADTRSCPPRSRPRWPAIAALPAGLRRASRRARWPTSCRC